MANITQRKNKNGEISYLIRVFVDQKLNGKQIVKSMTYKPEEGMSQKQIDKKLNETVILFEQKIKSGIVAFDGNVKFEVYAANWLENTQISPKKKEQYKYLLVRINQAIGHIKLQNIQAHHLEAFYKNLAEDGVRVSGKYAISSGLDKIMGNLNISRNKLSAMANVSDSTVGAARKGKRISIKSAELIANALQIPINQIFEINKDSTELSSCTIAHHHKVISIILAKAKRERIIQYNVAAEHTKAPKVVKKEACYLDDIQAKKLVELLLLEEDIRIKTAILLALYSGVRRGELCGLSWSDIDEKNNLIHILKASQYQVGIGIVEVSTKNESSKRAIKLPPLIFEVLTEYKSWWLKQKILNGNRWQGEEGRLFIQADGKPINPDTINYWLDKFIEKHDLKHFTPHSLRHTFSTLQIMAGVNIRTLQSRTGHAQASTLTNIYAHAIKTADEIASEVLDNILTPKLSIDNNKTV